jgi:hypothetical protein
MGDSQANSWLTYITRIIIRHILEYVRTMDYGDNPGPYG